MSWSQASTCLRDSARKPLDKIASNFVRILCHCVLKNSSRPILGAEPSGETEWVDLVGPFLWGDLVAVGPPLGKKKTWGSGGPRWLGLSPKQ
jgi:hypothetical protein